MTDLAALARADLNACFDLFERTAERLEVLPAYAVGGAEEERLRAFRLGLPRPERSVRTSPWLARIARTTAAGKSWRRIRVLGWPLTEYQRYQLTGYQESAAAGDVIRIADRSAHPELAALDRDFWLFDADGPQPFAALMTYRRRGRVSRVGNHRGSGGRRALHGGAGAGRALCRARWIPTWHACGAPRRDRRTVP